MFGTEYNPAKQKCHLLLLLLLLLQCIPATWNELEMLHIWFLAVNVLYWISLYVTATTDPGYLPRNAPAYDEAIKQVLMCLLSIF